MEITPYPLDPRYGATRDGRVFRIVRARFGKPVPHEMKPSVGAKGYLYVGSGKSTGLRIVRVHQVIARTFIPNPLGLPEVAHEDGVKTNNGAGNLRWSTTQDNQIDRLRHGTHNRGERHPLSRLSNADVAVIRASSLDHAALATQFGVGADHIKRVRANQKRRNG